MFSLFKKKSHSQRLIDGSEEMPLNEVQICVARPVVRVVDGKIVNDIEFTADYSPDAKLRVDDFALANLIACDATPENLCQLRAAGFSFSDDVVKSIESISNDEDKEIRKNIRNTNN